MTHDPKIQAAVDEVLHKDARVQRFRWADRIIVLLAGIVIVGALVVSGIALVQQDEISEQQDRLVCFARLTADFQATVSDALSAPVDSVERDEALAEITRVSRRLHAIEQVC